MTTPAPHQGRIMPPLVMAFRAAARRNPGTAAARLHRLLTADNPPTDLGLVADLWALQAELLHQTGDLPAALDAVVAASRAAAAVQPGDLPRRVTALLISADLAVCAGHREAVPACDSARHALTRLDEPDPERQLLADALHAVAIWHTDPVAGAGLLQALRLAPAPAAFTAMLDTGLTAMRRESARLSGHGRPPPVPGAWLQPHVDHTTVGYLADRIHTCLAHHEAATS